MNSELTPAEQTIMEALWENGHWMKISELMGFLEEKGIFWKRQTINTFLTHLEEKGFVKKEGRAYLYICDKEEYEAQKAGELLNTYYGGSLKNFVAALSGNHVLDEEDLRELRDYLEQL